MKNEALYNKTVDILVQAYFNDTLQHGNQCGCAVGNIIVSNLGIHLKKYLERDNEIYWTTKNNIYWTTKNNQLLEPLWYDVIRHCDMTKGEAEQGLNQINSTGYSGIEIYKIEKAFERATKGESKEDWMFNGLMAVVEVLDIIHENTDVQLSANTKQKFEKPVALQV